MAKLGALLIEAGHGFVELQANREPTPRPPPVAGGARLGPEVE